MLQTGDDDLRRDESRELPLIRCRVGAQHSPG